MSSERKPPTVLIDAVQQKDLQRVLKILDGGADVNEICHDPEDDSAIKRETTALHKAIETNHFDLVKLLIDRGADIQREVEFKGSPLEVALKQERWRMVDILVEKGADINAPTKHHPSLLHAMVHYNCPKAVHTLIFLGADCSIKNTYGSGQTPLQLAKKLAKRELIDRSILYDLSQPDTVKGPPKETEIPLLEDYKGLWGNVRLSMGLHTKRERALLRKIKKGDPAAIRKLGIVGDSRHYQLLKPLLTKKRVHFAAAEALEKLGWKPESRNEMVRFYMAKNNFAWMNENFGAVKSVLLADLESGNPDRIEYAMLTFIAISNPDIIPDLISVLDSHGTVYLAESFLNCGQENLMHAARMWAIRNNYNITQGRGARPVSWVDRQRLNSFNNTFKNK